MAKIIDTRATGGQLVVLGNAMVLPTSNASTFAENVPAVAGSLRFNDDLDRIEYLNLTDGEWQALTQSSSTGEGQFFRKSGGTVTGSGIAIRTSGLSDAVVMTGGDGVLSLASTGSIILPKGTTAERPAATAGALRWGTTSNDLEFADTGGWTTLTARINALATTVSNTGISAIDFTPYLQKAGGRMTGALQVRTTGTTDGVAITGGDGVLNLTSTGSVNLPSGTTAQQPAATAGGLRWNTTTSDLEFGNGTAWKGVNALATEITDAAITSLMVPTAKLNDGAVTEPKLANAAVSNAKLASVPTQTLKGRSAAGSGDPADLSIAQVMSMLTLMGAATSGAAGSKGLVPAPAAGDQGKFLRGDATWATMAQNLSSLPLFDYDLTGNSGYIKIGVSPNALFVQWGYYGGGAEIPTITFPNGAFQEAPMVWLQGYGTGTTREGAEVPFQHVRQGTVTTTSFAATNILDQYDQSDSISGGEFAWFAWGRG